MMLLSTTIYLLPLSSEYGLQGSRLFEGRLSLIVGYYKTYECCFSIYTHGVELFKPCTL